MPRVTNESASVPVPPSGCQYEITFGAQRAVVTEVGAALRAYNVGERAVLEPFEADEPPAGGHGQVLMPWPNRVAGGRWTWDDAAQQLALTEVSAGNAIHGLVRWMPWQAVRHTADAVELEVLVGAQPGWPFVLRCSAAYALGADGLTVALSGTNVGTAPCPWGAGSHPYVATPGGVDTATVTLLARTWLATDDRGIPSRREPVAGSLYVLDGTSPIGDRRLDTAYTDLHRDADGTAAVVVTGADGWRTTVRGGVDVRWLQVFTGDTLSDRFRRTALAVEPMTCPPDALNSGTDLIVLAPGETGRLTWTVHAEPAGGATSER